jgi:hypothetical protein
MSPPRSRLTASSPQGAKKHLGRPGVFQMSPPTTPLRGVLPQGAKKHLGRPGVFLERGK